MAWVPVAGPWITDKEIGYVTDAVANCWYSKAHAYTERFEAAFAAYVNRKFAIALPSCTSAIHLALLALGVGPGDEVIVPDVTWIASAAPISYVGATPVFADIDPRTWCLDVASFEACITPRTKAVIPVDLYGGLPDYVALEEVAARRGVAVIEDAAQAVGATLRGRRAGSFGVASVFSFHGSKTLTTGEGGMLLTDRADIRERALFLRDHGRAPGDRFFYNTAVAYKYRISNLQSALGLGQLERVDQLVERKRQIFGWYRERLGRRPDLKLNADGPGVEGAYWMSTIVLDAALGLEKRAVMDLLAKRGVDSRPFFFPLSSLPAYASTPGVHQARERNVVARELSPWGVNLPSGLSLDRQTVGRVCDAVEAVLRR